MTINTEPMYWAENEDWYAEDRNEKYGIRLTPNAPERAKESFEMRLELQKKPQQ